MAQAAAHLVGRVIPDVPVRQWVLSVPKPLRLAMAMDADLCRAITRAHLRAVSASYVRRAKAMHALAQEEEQAHDGLAPAPRTDASSSAETVEFHPGAVNATQRFGTSLELNVHFHSAYLDGVYITRGPFDHPVFIAAGPLTSKEVSRVHGDLIARIRRVLEKYGLNPLLLGLPPRPGGEESFGFADSSSNEQPLLDFGDARDGPFFPSLKAASVASRVPFGARAGVPLQRLRDPHIAQAFEAAGWSTDPGQRVPPPLVANSHGFSLHAATRIPKGQRDRLEKLCRYITRPALCPKRLEVLEDGHISWSLHKPWRDGTKAFVFTPYEFIAKLAALVPHPREHQLTYQGVLAPASPLRDEVVPRPVVRKDPKDAGAEEKASAGVASETPCSMTRPYVCWAELLKRVFGDDVLRCPRCRGRRHMISVITDPETVRKVLDSVRSGLEKNATSSGGGDGHPNAEGRSPPALPSLGIPMPPRQGRLDFEGC